MKSIIGQSYISNDNSYMINLTTPEIDYRLAGTLLGDNPIVTKIISEPYEFGIKSIANNELKTYQFINVEHDGYIFRVLYQENNVNADLEETKKRLKEISIALSII